VTDPDHIARMAQDFTPLPLSGRKCQFSGKPIELCEDCCEVEAQSDTAWALAIITAAALIVGGWIFWSMT